MNKSNETAFFAADILLPNAAAMSDCWAVCACDQYTGEPAYWAETERLVGDKASTLRLILPELYLEESDVAERIAAIQNTMRQYLDENKFTKYSQAMIYVERIQSDGKCRAGLIGAIDLEQYDYNKGSVSPVRATEATVAERIPPRVRIRRGAALELPHIMILLDDANKTVIEPISAQTEQLQMVYDTTLMQGGGSIRGWLLPESTQQRVLDALTALGDADAFAARYDLPAGTAPLVYAMGDGNHSLATAKAYYEEWKTTYSREEWADAPARYALVELVNLHSPALEFEAIHRILTGVDTEKLCRDMTAALALTAVTEPAASDAQYFTILQQGHAQSYRIGAPSANLTVGSVQNFLDQWLRENDGKIDYIHGADVVKNLSNAEHCLGILLPDMQKSELFPTVIADGALPRKTFSMGHAADKRYYMECRCI